MLSKIKSYFIEEWQIDSPLMWMLTILFCIQFLPNMGAFDVASLRWYALAIVNFGGFIFLLCQTRKLHPIWTASLWKNKVSISYGLFLAASALSIIQAQNKIESLHVLTHLLISFFTFIHFALLLQARLRLFDLVVKITHILLFINLCVLFIGYFYFDLISRGISGSMAMSGGYGNKNIFAAAIVLKLPFVLYSMYMYKRFWKIFSGLLFFAATIGIFILTARATFISLFLLSITIIGFCTVYIIKKQRIKFHLLYIGSLILLLSVGTGVSKQILNYSIKVSKTYSESLAVGERIKSINANSNSAKVRLFYWHNAIETGKTHFPYGCGLGNNKIESLKLENQKISDFIISKHTHNDFLELFAEIGLGVIFYILIFVFAVWNFVVVIFSRRSFRTHFINLIAILGLAIYAIDAMFNFPLERPGIQLYFAFFLALNIVIFVGKPCNNILNQRKIKILLVTLLSLILATLILTFLAYRSSRMQFQTFFDQRNNQYKYSYEKVKNNFPFIPSISEICVPISVMKSEYLIHEGKFDEAIDLLIKDSSSNPYIVLREMKLKEAFLRKGDTASAIAYGQKAIDLRPNYYPNSKELANIYCSIHAVDSAQSIIDDYIKLNPESPSAWIDKSQIAWEYGKDYKRGIQLLDSAIEMMPLQKPLYKQKLALAQKQKIWKDIKYFGHIYIDSFPEDTFGYTEMGDFYAEKKQFKQSENFYKQALGYDSLNYKSLLGLAHIYLGKNKTKDALQFSEPCIKAKNKDIKAEAYYIQAYVFYKQKDTEKACEYLEESNTLGYKEAEKLQKKICKHKKLPNP